MRAAIVLVLLVGSGGVAVAADPKAKSREQPPKPTEPEPTAFAVASAQAASIRKQREAIARQQAVLGIPPAENSFFVLPSALNKTADDSFFILSER